MNRTRETEGYVVQTKAEVIRDLATYRQMLDHAIVRREELRGRPVAQEKRRLRGQMLNRLGNDISGYADRVKLLEGVLADMEG